jgi:hypothetical protein
MARSACLLLVLVSAHGTHSCAQYYSDLTRTYESAFVTYCLKEGPTDQLVRSLNVV